jgi:molybdopterin-guanine dinucleotide biosynthesis protein A
MRHAAWSAPPLVAGLLIGGASRRMGRPKALVEWGGSTLAERVAAAARAVIPELLLLGSGPVPGPLAACARLEDPPGLAGPLAALAAALAARPDRAWLLLACDQPLLTPEAIRWLIDERRGGAVAVMARRSPERVEPLPAIYEPAAREAVAELRAAGELSLQPLGRRPDVATPVVPAALAAAWTSVDTPADLAALAQEEP